MNALATYAVCARCCGGSVPAGRGCGQFLLTHRTYEGMPGAVYLELADHDPDQGLVYCGCGIGDAPLALIRHHNARRAQAMADAVDGPEGDRA